MTLRPHLVLAAVVCACRPAVPPVSVVSPSVAVPDAGPPTVGRPAGREQARHVLAVGRGGFVVVGRRMESDSWDGAIGAWVARFDDSGRRVWSVQSSTEGRSAAELAAWDPDGGLFVLGRSSSPASLWVRSYGGDGALRWEQRFGNGSEFAVGFGTTPRGAWALVRPYGEAEVRAIHVSAEAVGEPVTALPVYEADSLEIGPAVAVQPGEFYFPQSERVLRASSSAEEDWDLADVTTDALEPLELAARAQAILSSPLDADTVSHPNGRVVTIQQDGRTLALLPGDVPEYGAPSALGLPWRDVGEAETALAWFSGVDVGDLDNPLSGASRMFALEALLERDLSDSEPIMIPVGCHEYEEVPMDGFVPIGHEHDALLAAIIEEASAEEVRRCKAPLLETIDQLPAEHPLGDSFVLSLDSHRVPEVAVALALNGSGAYRKEALEWLEAGGHREHLASLAQELHDGGEACEFVADLRAAQTRLGGTVPPPRTAGFADACEQLYELCATGSRDTSRMILDRGYQHVETCSDDFPTSPEDELATTVEPCEAVDETRYEDVDELLYDDMLDECSGDTISWGEYDPEGNCGVLVENDVHTVEFADSGGGRWFVVRHQVDWTVE
ncbi:MAG: hypothetical protein ACRBN8_01950 [Nannocystales bacterium]